MTPDPIGAAVPWHWWIGLFYLILDVIVLIGLAILYYRNVIVPTRPRHDSDDFPPSRRDGERRPAGTRDGG